jgi:hypothetical protein
MVTNDTLELSQIVWKEKIRRRKCVLIGTVSVDAATRPENDRAPQVESRSGLDPARPLRTKRPWRLSSSQNGSSATVCERARTVNIRLTGKK